MFDDDRPVVQQSFFLHSLDRLEEQLVFFKSGITMTLIYDESSDHIIDSACC